MPWRGPLVPGEVPSLGPLIIEWCEDLLRVPGGAKTGEPLRLTDEQCKFVGQAYRLDPRTGRRTFRRAVLRRAKGWGKSPIVGALAIAHLCGPTEFDGWDADGEPVGRPHPSPWVQVAATSEDQTDNTYRQLLAMIAESPVVDECGLDVGITRIFVRGLPQAVLEPVTSAAGSREGQPLTAAMLDETHLWLDRNGGTKLAATIRRNLGKMDGFSIETTNAHRPGEGSVAEQSHDAALRGAVGVLYDSIEAPPVADLHDRKSLLAGLKVAYGDSSWVDLRRIADEVVDPATSEADARRFFLNQLAAEADDAIELIVWDVLGVDAQLEDGDQITVGFDGSDGNDSTSLWALRASDQCLFRLGLWEKPEGAGKDWRIDRLSVATVVEDTFERFDVAKAFCDPPWWQSEIDGWHGRWPQLERFQTFSDLKMGAATARFESMLRAGELHHDRDPALRAHLAAMRRRPMSKHGWRPDKKDTRKIDAGVSAILAVHAYGEALADGLIGARKRPVFAW